MYENDARTSVPLKRLAYSAAITPRTRRKVRRLTSADLKPQESAISLSPREELFDDLRKSFPKLGSLGKMSVSVS